MKAQEFVRQERVFVEHQSLARLQVETKSNRSYDNLVMRVTSLLCGIIYYRENVTFCRGKELHNKVKERKKSDEGIPPKSRRSFQVKVFNKNDVCGITIHSFKMNIFPYQEDGSGKKPKKSPYVSPGKGVPCSECKKEFRNQAVLDRSLI